MSETTNGSGSSVEPGGTGVYVKKGDDVRELSDAEVRTMDREIELAVGNYHAGRPEVGAYRRVDPYELKARNADVIAGRDADTKGYWRQVMEHWGFNWLEPAQLDQTIGPETYIPSTIAALADEKIHDEIGREIANSRLYWTRPHTVGQWRSDYGKRRPPIGLTQGTPLAFTMADLIGNYGEPQAFDRWAKEIIARWIQKQGAIRRRASR